MKVSLKRSHHKHIASIASHIPPDKVVDMLERCAPQAAAKVAEYCESDMIESLMPFIPTSLLIDLCEYLSSQKLAMLVPYLPQDKLQESIPVMVKKGLGEKLGEIADLMNFKDLMDTINRLRDPKSIAVIVDHMTTYRKVAKITQSIELDLLTEILRHLLGPSESKQSIDSL